VIRNREHVTKFFNFIKEQLPENSIIIQIIGVLVKVDPSQYITFCIQKKIFVLLKYFHESGYVFDHDCAKWTASHKITIVLEFLVSIGVQVTHHLISDAALIGNKPMISYAIRKGYPMNEIACENAVIGGHLNILKLLRQNNCPWIANTISIVAAKYGRLLCMVWTLRNGAIVLPSENQFMAAIHGHINILDYYLNHPIFNVTLNKHIAVVAVQYGHLDILQWYSANGLPIDYLSINAAIKYDKYEIVHTKICPRKEV